MVKSLAEKMAARRDQILASGTTSKKTDTPESVDRRPPPRQESAQTPGEIIREQQQVGNADKSVLYVDLSLIEVRKQVRKQFDEDYITDLAIAFALSPKCQPDNPITLWEKPDGGYLLDQGENRVRAFKWAQENVAALKEAGAVIDDPLAFTEIRATIKGPMPSELDRLQSQVAENVLRDDLNYAELGLVVRRYRELNPEASQKAVAEWCGFRNAESGRVKIYKAMQILDIETDLFESVLAQELSANKALKLQAARNAERKEASATEATEQQATDSTLETGSNDEPAKPKKSKKRERLESGKRQQDVNISIDTAIQLCQLMDVVANLNGVQPTGIDSSSNRADVMKVFNGSLLDELLVSLES